MKISDFKLSKVYARRDLMDAYKGAFQGGINICKRTNTIVITSLSRKNPYGDERFEGEIFPYVGEGQQGDQKMVRGNKALLEAKEKGRDIHLFIRYKETEDTYFGIVELVGEPYFANRLDTKGEMRKVIIFPMMQRIAVRALTPWEMQNLKVAGVVPIEKQIIQVVGAAIAGENGRVLCAQRGYGPLIGKWEFPGGKVEKGETDQQALAREIKEELGIDIIVQDFIEESYTEYKDKNINLRVYKCKYVSGEINDTEHQSLKWMKNEELETLDWAEADIPIMESYLDSLPRRIDGRIDYDYFEAEAIKPSNKELQRAAQDYEKSQRIKQKSGENAEVAVIHYERDKLNNAGHPELAELVTQISKKNSAAGYDVKSYEINDDGSFSELHIEVKAATKTSKYIEFFISNNELEKFKNDRQHRIYCLIKTGRKYKLHEVNKTDFFSHKYLLPMSYRVRIRIAE